MPNYSFVQLPGNGVTKNFAFTFPYLNKTHVTAAVDGVNTLFTWLTSTIIQFPVAPPSGSVVEIRRVTPIDGPLVNYSNGSVLTEGDLDSDTLQSIYIAQEQEDSKTNSIQLASDSTYDALARRIKNTGAPTHPADAANKEYVDSQFASSAGAHSLFSHTDTNPASVVDAGSLMVGDGGAPSKMTTLPVGGKGAVLIGKPGDAKKTAWLPSGVDYAHLIAQSGKSDGLLWVPSSTFTSQELEMVNNGNTDNLTAFNAGLTALPAEGGRILLGPGTFDFSSTITSTKPLIIEGCGKGVTTIEINTLSSALNLFVLSRSTIFRHLTIKVKNPSDVDYNMSAIKLDISGGGVSGQFLQVDHVDFTGFDRDIYVDGGGISSDVSLVDYVLLNRTNLKIQTANDIDRHCLTIKRVKELELRACTIDGNNMGSHGAVIERVPKIDMDLCTFKNARAAGVRISTGASDTGPMDWWRASRSRFDTNACGVQAELRNNLYLPHLSLTDLEVINSIASATYPAAVHLLTKDTAELGQIKLDVIVKNAGRNCVLIDNANTSVVRQVTIENFVGVNWGTETTNTYDALVTTGAGSIDTICVEQSYFDGVSKGRKPFAFAAGPAVQYGPVFAKGCTDATSHAAAQSMRVGATNKDAKLQGVLARFLTSVGTINNTSETDLWSYSVLGNTLAVDGATLRVHASGRFAANGNTKTLRLKWGSTVICTHPLIPTPNAVSWVLDATIIRTAANTQRCSSFLMIGSTHDKADNQSVSLTDTANQTLSITGQNGTASSNDIIMDYVELSFAE